MIYSSDNLDGTITAAVTGGGKDACFTNTCKEPLKPSEDTVVPEKKLTAAGAVDTGVESNTSQYVTLIVISAADVAVITVLKSRSKKAD